MLSWDLTIFGNTIGIKDRGEIIPCTWFHSFFLRKKSEIRIAFTFFEKWKIKSLHSFLRSESEIETARDREREVKMKINSRKTRISLISDKYTLYDMFGARCYLINNMNEPGQSTHSVDLQLTKLQQFYQYEEHFQGYWYVSVLGFNTEQSFKFATKDTKFQNIPHF